MTAINQIVLKSSIVVSLFIDAVALAFIYLLPGIAHLTNLPLYLIEPMRLMLILAIAHTSKNNAYLLAFSMPVFSFLISGHPVAPKMLLIAFELFINVFLFYLLKKKLKNIFTSIFLSILISKALYYIIKISLISLLIVNTEIVATPIVIQFTTTLFFSIYLYKFYSHRQVNS